MDTVPGTHRYYVRSSDSREIAGYDNIETAGFAARESGGSDYIVDTRTFIYHPMIPEVEESELFFHPLGGWRTGWIDLDQDLIKGIEKGHFAVADAFLAKDGDPNARHGEQADSLMGGGGRISLTVASGPG